MDRDNYTQVDRLNGKVEIRAGETERISSVVLVVILLSAAIVASATAKSQSETEKQTPSPSVETQATPAKEKPAGDSATGKKLFMKYGCYECHGTEGNGGTGPRINQPALSIVAIARYVRHPSGQMPPYSKDLLTDDQLADICAFVKSVPPPRPVASIPLLE
jgi:mono/diheme cytochrome c family protein